MACACSPHCSHHTERGLSFQSENTAEEEDSRIRMDTQEEGSGAGAQTPDDLRGTSGQVSGQSWIPVGWLVPTCPTSC